MLRVGGDPGALGRPGLARFRAVAELRVRGPGPAGIETLPELTSLLLMGAWRFEGAGFASLPGLLSLTLRQDASSPSGLPDDVGALRALRVLKLIGSSRERLAVPACDFPALRELAIEELDVGAGLARLIAQPGLEQVELRCSPSLPGDVGAAATLRSLTVEHAPGRDRPGLEHLTALRRLEIGGLALDPAETLQRAAALPALVIWSYSQAPSDVNEAPVFVGFTLTYASRQCMRSRSA